MLSLAVGQREGRGGGKGLPTWEGAKTGGRKVDEQAQALTVCCCLMDAQLQDCS